MIMNLYVFRKFHNANYYTKIKIEINDNLIFE